MGNGCRSAEVTGSVEVATEVMRSLQRGSVGVMGTWRGGGARKRDITGRICGVDERS